MIEISGEIPLIFIALYFEIYEINQLNFEI